MHVVAGTHGRFAMLRNCLTRLEALLQSKSTWNSAGVGTWVKIAASTLAAN